MQQEWLTKKFSQFLGHQANKTTSQFFPALYEEYFVEWMPTPTEEEITEADGDVAVVTANLRRIEENIHDFELTTFDPWLILIIRGSTVGCTTIPA
jgi:hypothetical protein